MMNKHTLTKICAALLSGIMLVGFVGCAANQKEEIIDINELVGTEFDMVPLGAAPVPVSVAMPVASGTKVLQNAKALIDVSHSDDGYLMVKYLEATQSKLKCIITCPSGTKYTYNLNNKGEYDVFPFSDGNGTYSIGVYKNVADSKYSVSYTGKVDVVLKDQFAPFRIPNQYVNYKSDSAVVKKAAELCASCTTDLERINAVYTFVINNFKYDDQLAATVTSGYLPDIDAVLASQKGICFDYAAVMTAMLRSQDIPCKLVIGYAGTVYHAWINAYSASEGWLNGVIFFDGQNWKLMDPTFASTGGESKEVMDYIGNGSDYTAMYLY